MSSDERYGPQQRTRESTPAVDVVYRRNNREHGWQFNVGLHLRLRDVCLSIAAITTILSSCGATAHTRALAASTPSAVQQADSSDGPKITVAVPFAHLVVDIIQR